MCAEYWPNESAGSLHFGDYIVELLDAKEFNDHTKREFKLTLQTVRQTCLTLSCTCDCPQQQLSESHTVIQYHYTGWPEQGSPSTEAGMVDLIDQVVKRQQQSGNRPVVVHCRYV